MSIPRRDNRRFGASDAYMLQFARVTHTNYTTDIADFTGFDPDFDVGYGDDFLAAIDAAEAFDSDDQIIDVLVQATLDVEAKMRECRNHFQGMKFFIKKAFPEKYGIWGEFGFNDYNRSRRVQVLMIQFMKNLFKVATKYTIQLTDANYGAANIALIETLGNELQELDTNQEGKKGARRSASNERVALLNACWDYVQYVRMAAKVIYMDNWTKWQLYLLPWGGEGQPPANPEEITGTVAHGTTVSVDVPGLTPDTVLTLANIGTVALRFCGSEIAAMDCGTDGIILNPGDSLGVTLQEIAPASTNPVFLNASHTVAPPGSPDAEYSVTKIT